MLGWLTKSVHVCSIRLKSFEKHAKQLIKHKLHQHKALYYEYKLKCQVFRRKRHLICDDLLLAVFIVCEIGIHKLGNQLSF